MTRGGRPGTVRRGRDLLPCPCGSAEVWIYIVGNDGGIHPQHGRIPWPIPTRTFCSPACAIPHGWPWLRSEEARPDCPARRA